LCSQNIIVKTEQQIEQENATISFKDFSKDYFVEDVIPKDNGDVFKLLKSDKPLYKLQFRFKAFMPEYARIKIAKFALRNNINDIIRIQTDGLVYTKPQKFQIHNIVEEKDKTGKIRWYNVNNFERIEY
jgi:hypothetical protein